MIGYWERCRKTGIGKLRGEELKCEWSREKKRVGGERDKKEQAREINRLRGAGSM